MSGLKQAQRVEMRWMEERQFTSRKVRRVESGCLFHRRILSQYTPSCRASLGGQGEDEGEG